MKQKTLGLIVYLLYRLYSWSFRYQVIFEDPKDEEEVLKDLSKKKPHSKSHILAFYHQQELSCITFFANRGIYVMVSQSQDGQIMATALSLFGYKVIRGSSHRRAVAGFIECLRKAKEGYKLTMAVDGPRGPIYKVKEGIPKLSEKSQRPILPVCAKPLSFFRFEKSWNKMLLPKPFSKIKIIFGKVGFYTPQSLEEKLNQLRTL